MLRKVSQERFGIVGDKLFQVTYLIFDIKWHYHWDYMAIMG